MILKANLDLGFKKYLLIHNEPDFYNLVSGASCLFDIAKAAPKGKKPWERSCQFLLAFNVLKKTDSYKNKEVEEFVGGSYS